MRVTSIALSVLSISIVMVTRSIHYSFHKLAIVWSINPIRFLDRKRVGYTKCPFNLTEDDLIEGEVSALFPCCRVVLKPAGDASCAGPGDRSERRCDRSQGTGRALHPCVSESDGSAHRSGRTSTYSLPTCTCKASLLYVCVCELSDGNFWCRLCCTH